MKRLLIISTIAAFLFSYQNATAQEAKKLTFDEVIKLAEVQSPDALTVRLSTEYGILSWANGSTYRQIFSRTSVHYRCSKILA
jgi:hypothetical protein